MRNLKLKNIYLALKAQLPLKRLLKNILNGNILGLFHINSHIKNGKVKVGYSEKSARKAAEKMSKKYNVYYSVYKCIYCDKWHIGKNMVSKK